MLVFLIILWAIVMMPIILISVARNNRKAKEQEQLVIQAEKDLAAQFFGALR